MKTSRTNCARAFTLIELLIVIAIIGILIAAIAVAVTKAKEVAWQAKCGTHIKQVMTSMNTFHEHNGVYPTYNGIYPTAAAGTDFNANSKAVYGSWFTHLLPYTENQGLYDKIREEVAQYGNGSGNVSIGGGTLISPATSGYYNPPGVIQTPAQTHTVTTTVPNPNYNNGQPIFVPTPWGGYTVPNTQSPTITTTQTITDVPAVWNPPNGPWVPGQPAVYGPPGAPYNGPVGIWKAETRRTVFKVLLCPSDSPDAANAGDGLVYKAMSSPWSATNYLANWNAITNGNGALGYKAPPGRRQLVEDGPGNTIYLAEAFSWCDGKGRMALLAWYPGTNNTNTSPGGGLHNFGLTFAMTSVTFNSATNPVPNSSGNPNPAADPPLNFGFQIQPPTQTGTIGCVPLTAQSPHSSLNVVMGDGAVRKVRESITNTQWMALMLPSDGQPAPGLD